jgi:glucokinase
MEEYNIKTRVVGVDISNERTTYAVVDIRGNILAEDSFPTTDYPDVNNFVTALSEKIVMLVEDNGGYETIRSIGVSSPSASPVSGCIENAANLPWKGVVPLAAMLRDRLGLAVGLSNDAHVSALGEYTFGSAHGMKNFIIISLGVGIGSCFFSDGSEHQGHLGFAGEFGHTCVVEGKDGRECGCGHRGCLEAYVGAVGIARTAKELLAESDAPSIMRDLEKISPRVIYDCCEKGDELAIEVFRRTGYMLGLGLANYASIIDPEAIILTGGISHAGKWLLEPAVESFENHVFGNLRGKVKIFTSRLNDRERDVLGASALAWSVPEYSLFK